MSNLRWRFRKILWPSQNIWTLKINQNFDFDQYGSRMQKFWLFLHSDMMKKDSYKLAISLVAQETNVKLRNLKLKKSSSLVFFSHDLTCAHVKIRFTIIWPVAVQCTAAAAVVAVMWRRRQRRQGSNRRCLGSRTSALYYARLKRVYCREN